MLFSPMSGPSQAFQLEELWHVRAQSRRFPPSVPHGTLVESHLEQTPLLLHSSPFRPGPVVRVPGMGSHLAGLLIHLQSSSSPSAFLDFPQIGLRVIRLFQSRHHHPRLRRPRSSMMKVDLPQPEERIVLHLLFQDWIQTGQSESPGTFTFSKRWRPRLSVS